MILFFYFFLLFAKFAFCSTHTHFKCAGKWTEDIRELKSEN